MFKFLCAMIAVAMLGLVSPAMADDLLYDGSGSPIPSVFSGGNIASWNLDTEFGSSGDSPGFLTGTGPGGYAYALNRDFDSDNDGVADNNDNPLLFSRGWRVAWRARTANVNEPQPGASAGGQALAVSDDSHQVRVAFEADGQIGGGEVRLQAPMRIYAFAYAKFAFSPDRPSYTSSTYMLSGFWNLLILDNYKSQSNKRI